MIEEVSQTPLQLTCDLLKTEPLQCNQIYGDDDDTIMVGCTVPDGSPVLVSVKANVSERKLVVQRCVVFQRGPVQSEEVNLSLKYVAPENNFVIL